MRSDAKLGLALGMLVVGFAVAFCFPREGRPTVLQQVAQREEQQKQTENIEFVPIRNLREATEQQEIVPSVASILSPSKEEKIESAVSVEPELPSSKISSNSGLKEILHQAEQVNLTEQQAQSTQEVVPQQREDGVYLVQDGDTLSGISLKTLGSYSRYLDIYEANKDVLQSPDDLRLGMELKIPLSKPLDAEHLADQDLVLPEEKGESPLETTGAPAKRFSSPSRAPFLSDRRESVPVHQIQAGQVKTHVVQTGDSLERISIRYFGTARAVQHLRKLNPEVARDPRHLRPGTIIRLAE